MTTKLTENNFAEVKNLGFDWQSVVTADGSTATTAVAGKGYFIDTTSNTHTVTLPASPNQGDSIAIRDYAGTFGTNNVTVDRNGNNIKGSAANLDLTINGSTTELFYVDSTKGWLLTLEGKVASGSSAPSYITATGGTIANDGDYKVHTFTGDGCFVVSSVGNSAGSNSVMYLVVAGGGGGGTVSGGGGGAGGFVTSGNVPGGLGEPVAVTTYPIVVGGGGTGQSTRGTPPATKGTDSTFSTITATGGGFGGKGNNGGPVPSSQGGPGGSGGGAAYNSLTCGGSGGTGNSPPVFPQQGLTGGSAGPYVNCQPISDLGGGGGGGAASVGGVGEEKAGGMGGAGRMSDITGTKTVYASGGGGGVGAYGQFSTERPGGAPGNQSPTSSTALAGGGGKGGTNLNSGTESNGEAGTANTGGGGGGAGYYPTGDPPGGAGGKGIVIIRYKYQ